MEDLGIWNMHKMLWEFKGLKFGGSEGSVHYKITGKHQYYQDEALEFMKGFPAVDVFIAHSPSYQINDH